MLCRVFIPLGLKRRRRLFLSKTQLRGQSTVEYMLLISVVVGAAVIFQKVLVPQLHSFLSGEVSRFQKYSWKGGGEDPYLNKKGGCAETNSQRLCRSF